MKKVTSVPFIIAISLLALFPGCSKQASQEKKKGVVVVNVLDKELYDDCHIKGSIHVPFDEVETSAQAIDKNAEIVVYCSNYMCTASGYAAKRFRELGFPHVQVYEAGMAEWYQQGFPIQGPAHSEYLSHVMPTTQHAEVAEVPLISTQELAQKLGMSSLNT